MPVVKYINDVEDVFLRPYKGLSTRILKADNNLFIAETHTVIKNAIEAGCVPCSFLVAEKYIDGRDKDLLNMFPETVVYTASDETLKQLTGFSLTRGILSVMQRPKLKTPAELINKASCLLVLENVQDASNIGAILRSACGIGVDAVLLDPSCCDPFHRKAVRTSMGAVFKVPWTYSQIPGYAIASQLDKMGFSTMAFALSPEAIPLQSISFNSKENLALFFGSEGNGLDERTISSCRRKVIIPMKNNMNSLNVAVSVAIALWECAKRANE